MSSERSRQGWQDFPSERDVVVASEAAPTVPIRFLREALQAVAEVRRKGLYDIIEAARNLPGAEMRQEGPIQCKHGFGTPHDGGEFACAGPIAEKNWMLVIPIVDARRTEEE